MKISVLLPYKPDHDRRDYLWSQVREWYNRNLPELELCIGIDESEPFCRSRGVNEAAKKASGDIFILADTDMIFDLDLICSLMTIVKDHPWIIPFKLGHRLTKAASDRLIAQGLPPSFDLNDNDIEISVSIPGAFMNVMPRHCFEKISGLDERFKGWGFEDEAMVRALNTLCGNYYRMNSVIYHLWHPRTEGNHPNHHNNYLLYRRYVDATNNSEAMKQLIAEQFQ